MSSGCNYGFPQLQKDFDDGFKQCDLSERTKATLCSTHHLESVSHQCGRCLNSIEQVVVPVDQREIAESVFPKEKTSFIYRIPSCQDRMCQKEIEPSSSLPFKLAVSTEPSSTKKFLEPEKPVQALESVQTALKWYKNRCNGLEKLVIEQEDLIKEKDTEIWVLKSREISTTKRSTTNRKQKESSCPASPDPFSEDPPKPVTIIPQRKIFSPSPILPPPMVITLE